jgi:hypothetical protein
VAAKKETETPWPELICGKNPKRERFYFWARKEARLGVLAQRLEIDQFEVNSGDDNI